MSKSIYNNIGRLTIDIEDMDSTIRLSRLTSNSLHTSIGPLSGDFTLYVVTHVDWDQFYSFEYAPAFCSYFSATLYLDNNGIFWDTFIAIWETRIHSPLYIRIPNNINSNKQPEQIEGSRIIIV